MLVKLLDLPEISPLRFRGDNSVNYMRVGTPIYLELSSGLIKVEPDFRLVGWCRKMPDELMFNRKDQIGIMMFSEEYGELWEHYPLYDQEDYEDAVFSTKKEPV